jgi:hypothetical protein
MEVQRAKRWENEQKQAISSRAKEVEEVYNTATKQIEITRSLHSEAVKRAKESNDRTRKVASMIVEAKEAHLEERTNAVLELKVMQTVL